MIAEKANERIDSDRYCCLKIWLLVGESVNDNGVFRHGRCVEVGELDCVCRQGGQD